MIRAKSVSVTAAALVLGATMLVTGCGQGELSWKTKDIAGVMPDLAFTLTSETGQTVQASDYRGKVRLLFFGYTNCPDVCPTTLSVLAQALDRLGEQADAVRVLFVSVDPKRDSPQRLKQYTSAFNPRVVGLTGARAEIDELTKRYRTTYSYGEPDVNGNYTVNHGSGIYIFDREGEVRLFAKSDYGVDAIAHDLRQLVAPDSSPQVGWHSGRFLLGADEVDEVAVHDGDVVEAL